MLALGLTGPGFGSYLGQAIFLFTFLTTIHVWNIVFSPNFRWMCIWFTYIHILVYQNTTCVGKLWNISWLCSVILWISIHNLTTIIHVWRVLSSPNFHRLCFWLKSTIEYVDIPDVTTGYARLTTDLNVFVWEFSIIIKCLKCFYLHQTFTNLVFR